MTEETYNLILEAMGGNPVAMTSLGIKYYYGNDVKRCLKTAVACYKVAADQEYAQAKYLLALCYLNGEGTVKKEMEAISLLEEAAQQDCHKARYKLASMLLYKQGGIDYIQYNRRNRDKDIHDKLLNITSANHNRVDWKSVEHKQANQKPADQTRAGQKTDDQRSTDQKAIDQKPTDQTPTNQKPANHTPARHFMGRREMMMPREAKIRLAEKPDESSKGSKNKQLKRNEEIRKFPWEKAGVDVTKIDLRKAQQLMDKELYGLKTIKRQILRYLAVCKKNPKSPLRPLLLIGPPGVGKSSFGKAIAKALNKPIKVISMPSIAAACELTGNEKYWETSGCGIIVKSIIDVGDFPVFLIDEVDKAGKISGRHASAQHGLLNLLDDNRSRFYDVFFEVPVNLENVLFILTANDEDNVDSCLLDRCKVLNIEGYKNIDERRVILEDYILPKLCASYGILPESYFIPDFVKDMILSESMDREGGLRTLQIQAEAILQELILRRETENIESCSDLILTEEDAENILSEISADNRTIGFSADDCR